MLLEDNDLDTVQWTPLSRGFSLGVGGRARTLSAERIGALFEVRLRVAGPGQIMLEGPLGNASGVWHGGADSRGLPADWAGSESFGAVRSVPLLVLCDVDGSAQVGIALDSMVASGRIEYGVSEESKSFVARVALDDSMTDADGEVVLLFVADREPYGDAVRLLSRRLRAGLPSRPVSPYAVEPVYSSWYSYSQRISADIIRDEALRAREIGCRSVFIDDGWQRFGDGRWYAGCGDWVPDETKFPDLRGSVEELHEAGMGVILWVAPLLLGAQSEAFSRLSQYAPHHSAGLRAHVLDPRIPQVREHLAETCARLMADYALDGLKVDFLNNAMVYAGTESPGDIADVGEAMRVLLADISAAAERTRPGSLIEYRQPYVSPAIAGYADVIRVTDCPADADQNRRSSVDLRLFATDQVVHSDPIMWDPRAGVDAAARQVLNAFFSVPQFSMPMASLPADQRELVRGLLDVWRGLRDVLVRGTITAALPGEGYPVIASRLDGVLVVAAYQERILELDLDGVERLVLINGTAASALPYRVTSGDPARFGLEAECAIEVRPWSVTALR
ncbi:alpha-galactosidase [Microbacterium bovistercoris]|uniref:Alpha-galactosidase n=1 Tax=Microbacterium bovistercoris TaxID=2293570 RepID=A0A371NU94_9MICO|nr:glycoside hydrolase family 36 protein [Microbacterium bovistercoris]REJ05845.1 alpha-galactosidase [Microbacterium bovistercoris]